MRVDVVGLSKAYWNDFYIGRTQKYIREYDEYLARGCPIARGVIEGACRHEVKDRLEGSTECDIWQNYCFYGRNRNGYREGQVSIA